jgi:predicted nucleic acid-binding protein
MRRIFANSLYWIAIALPKDQWHAQAMACAQGLQTSEIITTEEVLNEFLTAFRYNITLRTTAVRYVEGIRADPLVMVIPQSHHSFQAGYALYQARPDKQYSLTDCISMEAMRREGITEVLTHDGHFTQEGFAILL